ncbi:hypothetical protein M501DRAFT_979421 [Patellaria atrata CBS 101060]|uniref:Pre-mRNA-splicing factor CWC24 n=1 Tax=Patellaria atrata CBS 101060 TaxID=1346257 RepID=A0A9P4S630_9PEZI|nr:hypothetical protein M501DRAFT_979421 [Patellaria atrata CBS 101060]
MEIETEQSVTVFKKRSGKTKSSIRKRPVTPPPASDSGSDFSSEDETGRKIKRRRKAGILTASTVKSKSNVDTIDAPKHEADKSATITQTNDATRQSNWYEESSKDPLSAADLLRKTRNKPSEPASTPSNTYKGTKSYATFIQKNPDAPNRQMGPIKVPTNIRTITVTDYAPDVCKDYKQTGFCGFGDNCKFLHAREDYKQGWELDRDWEVGTKGKKVAGQTVASANRAARLDDAENDEDNTLLENIPFACIICKESYKFPVTTKCGHYFCEDCALQRYRKNPACAACGADTHGVFNSAKHLKKLLEKKKERARKRRERAKEEGLEVTDDEEEAE